VQCCCCCCCCRRHGLHEQCGDIGDVSDLLTGDSGVVSSILRQRTIRKAFRSLPEKWVTTGLRTRQTEGHEDPFIGRGFAVAYRGVLHFTSITPLHRTYVTMILTPYEGYGCHCDCIYEIQMLSSITCSCDLQNITKIGKRAWKPRIEN
jgi:hypothetical protein